jgi:NADH:ubiquinone oxidoreductase subunit 5 (subunit L)/multisubunit Na+/H+ antiporter MnhA subunit
VYDVAVCRRCGENAAQSFRFFFYATIGCKDSVAARKAGRTTPYVQSAGDLALLAGIVVIYITFGTFDLTKIVQTLATSPTPRLGSGTGWSIRATDVITGLLVLLVMTKSIQFPFHVWCTYGDGMRMGAFALVISHLCGHGLFKVTLFLNSGANIHKARVEFKLPPQRAA